MKRIANILILITGFSLNGNAQQDPAAVPYLERISQKLDPGKTIRIDFDYTREDLQAGSEVNGEGTLFLLGQKYRIEIEDAIIWFDGNKQYSLNKEVEEVYVRKPDPDNKEFMFSDPIRLLRSYHEEFKYMLLGEGDIRGIHCVILQLDPLELGGPYAVLKLFVRPENKELIAIQVRHKEGILYTMIVTEFDQEEDMPGSFFRFSEEEWPMVDVIELVD